MNSETFARVILKYKYRMPKQNTYTHRFFDDLSTGYASYLDGKDVHNDFFFFEPNDCELSKLLSLCNVYSRYYEIEQLVDSITYSLLAFGKSYLYIKPEYSFSDKENKTGVKILSSIGISEIKGYIRRRNKSRILFCQKGFNGALIDIDIPKTQLVVFDIRDLGFSKGYFKKINSKLGKLNIIPVSTEMLANNVDEYDFIVHSRKNKLLELRAIKDIGWSFGFEELSDSYILYKRIVAEKTKERFLDYILERINEGLTRFIGYDGGRLVARVNRIDYTQLWDNFSKGIITVTDLNKILFHV